MKLIFKTFTLIFGLILILILSHALLTDARAADSDAAFILIENRVSPNRYTYTLRSMDGRVSQPIMEAHTLGRDNWFMGFSPDAAWILYYEYHQENNEALSGIYRVRTNGQDAQFIAQGQLPFGGYHGTDYLLQDLARLSSDGQWLLLGLQPPDRFPDELTLYLMRPDGSEVREAARGVSRYYWRDDRSFSYWIGEDLSTKDIALNGMPPTESPITAGGMRREIEGGTLVYEADVSPYWRVLTVAGETVLPLEGENYVFSRALPSGWLIFLAYDPLGPNAFRPTDLLRIRPDGSGRASLKLTNQPDEQAENLFNYFWSPDGNWLYVNHDAGTERHIIRKNINTLAEDVFIPAIVQTDQLVFSPTFYPIQPPWNNALQAYVYPAPLPNGGVAIQAIKPDATIPTTLLVLPDPQIYNLTLQFTEDEHWLTISYTSGQNTRDPISYTYHMQGRALYSLGTGKIIGISPNINMPHHPLPYMRWGLALITLTLLWIFCGFWRENRLTNPIIPPVMQFVWGRPRAVPLVI